MPNEERASRGLSGKAAGLYKEFAGRVAAPGSPCGSWTEAGREVSLGSLKRRRGDDGRGRQSQHQLAGEALRLVGDSTRQCRGLVFMTRGGPALSGIPGAGDDVCPSGCLGSFCLAVSRRAGP